MSTAAWIGCLGWIGASLAVAALRGVEGARAGRLRLFFRRMKSPTVYLFSAYLLVAALVAPLSPGETTSPLLWLSFILPACYALASLASIGAERVSLRAGACLAALYGGAVLACGAVALALASPAFVPGWLK